MKRGYFQKVSHQASLGWCCCEAGRVAIRLGVLSLQKCPLLLQPPATWHWVELTALGHVGRPTWAAGEGSGDGCCCTQLPCWPFGECALLPCLAWHSTRGPLSLSSGYPCSLLLTGEGPLSHVQD